MSRPKTRRWLMKLIKHRKIMFKNFTRLKERNSSYASNIKSSTKGSLISKLRISSNTPKRDFTSVSYHWNSYSLGELWPPSPTDIGSKQWDRNGAHINKKYSEAFLLPACTKRKIISFWPPSLCRGSRILDDLGFLTTMVSQRGVFFIKQHREMRSKLFAQEHTGKPGGQVSTEHAQAVACARSVDANSPISEGPRPHSTGPTWGAPIHQLGAKQVNLESKNFFKSYQWSGHTGHGKIWALEPIGKKGLRVIRSRENYIFTVQLLKNNRVMIM